MKYIEAFQPLVTRIYVGSDVSQRMAHMQSCAGRVRKHVENIIFWPGRISFRFKGLVIHPVFLPFFFYLREVVIHCDLCVSCTHPQPFYGVKQEAGVGCKFSDFVRTAKMYTFDTLTM